MSKFRAASQPLPRYALLVLVVLVGFALRTYQLGDESLRGDEGFSAQYWAGYPLERSLSEIATIEPHPPLTYILFRAWGSTFGIQNEIILRLLPALGNLIGIAAMYALGKHLFDWRVGLLAALLWAVHPFEIWHAQDFRNYAIWASLSAATLWLGVRVITQNHPVGWALYALSAAVTALIFYTELLSIGALALYGLVVYRHQHDFLIRWLGIHLGIVILTAAAFIGLQGELFQQGGYGGTTGTNLNLIQLLTQFLPVLNFGETLPAAYTLLVGLGISGLFIFAFWHMTQHTPKAAYLVVLVATVPMILLSVVSLFMDIFIPRYMMNAIPAYLLLIAYAVLRVKPRLIGLSIAVIWLVGIGGSLVTYYTTYQKSPPWHDLVQYLEHNTHTDDIIIQLGIDSGLGYYYQFADIPASEVALPVHPQQPADEIRTQLARHAQSADTLWFVGRTFPDWSNYGIVEQWAADNMQRVRTTTIGNLPVNAYKSWQVAPDEFTSGKIATFASAIELVDTRILAADDTSSHVTVWLYWHSLEKTTSPLTAFVHLVGKEINPVTGSALWSQDDHPPQYGRINTANWESGTIHRGVFMLPIKDVIAGTYTLQTGFYDPQTNRRLTTQTGDDSVTIGTISLP